MDDFKRIMDSYSDHPAMLDQMKQVYFYTVCLGESNWSVPDNVVDKEFAEYLLATAKSFSVGGSHSEIEIELWIKHMGPVRGKSDSEQKEALKSWFAELKENGLGMDRGIPFDEFVGE